MEQRIETTLKQLQHNNMQAFFVETKEEAVTLVEKLLHPGDTVSHGGSMTLRESGVMDLLNNGNYHHLDRDKPGTTAEETQKIYREAFFADAYVTSTNAVTENGELYNVDGNCNRVAAMLFGPKSVIVVAGINKLVKDVDEAIWRVKTVAAPLNAQRLGNETYCLHHGECVSCGKDGASMTDGCSSEGRMCAGYVVHARQRQKDRIKVILVGEKLGY